MPINRGFAASNTASRAADADEFVAHAVSQSATILQSVKLEFHGHRSGMVADPFGRSWFIASKAEEASPEEMQNRWNAESGETA